MAKTLFEWDHAAAGDLMLRSPEIAEVCEEEAERMTRATGMAYKSDVVMGKTRVNARGYDSAKKEDGQYKKRSNGKVVYTQRRIKED